MVRDGRRKRLSERDVSIGFLQGSDDLNRFLREGDGSDGCWSVDNNLTYSLDETNRGKVVSPLLPLTSIGRARRAALCT